MEMAEDIKSSGCFWIERSCRPPADTEKLPVKINVVTSTLVDGDVVYAVGMSNPKVCVGGELCGTRAAIRMSQLYPKAEVP